MTEKVIGHIISSHSRFTPKRNRDHWYIDGTNGADTYAGSIPDRALATIAAALSVCGAGDILHIAQGTYDEAVVIPAALEGLEVVCEPGVVINRTFPGTVVTIAAPYVRWTGGRVSQAGQTAFVIAGAGFKGKNILADGCLEGFYLDQLADDSVFINCRSINHTAHGFNIRSKNGYFERCAAFGTAATRGFYLSHTDAHYNILFLCNTSNCSASGYEMVAGADGNVIARCNQSLLCGGPIDAGTSNSWVLHGTESDITSGNTLTEDLAVIDAQAGRIINFKDQWCALPIASLAIPAVAADLSLADVVFPAGFLKTGAVVDSIYLMVKWRKQIDSSSAPNAINGTGKAWRIKKNGAALADYIEGIVLKDNQMATGADATEGGDMIIGSLDVKAEVDDVDNETYNISGEQTTHADAPVVDGASLTLHDVYTGLRVYFSLD